jgi:hypothetical protein
MCRSVSSRSTSADPGQFDAADADFLAGFAGACSALPSSGNVLTRTL